MNDNIKTIINHSATAVRADILLATTFTDYSRSALAKLFEQSAITTDHQNVKPGDKIKAGDDIVVDTTNLRKPVASITMPILFEDNDVIVVDKPAGVISHARSLYWDEPSVASFIRNRVVDGTSSNRAGIVHRLDRATSGVMICAKNSNALSFLQKQFANRQVKKSYTAIIKGTLEPSEAIIDIPIGRHPKKPNTFRPDHNGKVAITSYKVTATNSQYSLLNLQPATGRTHQLRVHLQYINHPIVGDFMYGGEVADRLFLHANSLIITLPNHHNQLFRSPLPDDFKKLMA